MFSNNNSTQGTTRFTPNFGGARVTSIDTRFPWTLAFPDYELAEQRRMTDYYLGLCI
jgi:hypothetical protein